MDEIGECPSIREHHPDQWDLFMYLFERHSNYPEKFDGLRDVSIRYNPVFKDQLEAIIIKNNGDEDDVSVLNNCITGKRKDNLTVAMRNSIRPQIVEFRQNNSLVCELCKSTRTIEIDHFEPQFADLKAAFLDQYNGVLPVQFRPNNSHSKVFIEDDIDFENEWNAYHQENATLRVLCRSCNSSRESSSGIKRLHAQIIV